MSRSTNWRSALQRFQEQIDRHRVKRGGRAARAAAILRKNGYKVIGSCGLAEWKERNYPLIYPKQGEKK